MVDVDKFSRIRFKQSPNASTMVKDNQSNLIDKKAEGSSSMQLIMKNSIKYGKKKKKTSSIVSMTEGSGQVKNLCLSKVLSKKRKHEIYDFITKRSKLTKTGIMKNGHLTTLKNKWNLPVKLIESELRVYFILLQISQVLSYKINTGHEMIQAIEKLRLEEIYFQEFIGYYNHNSHYIVLRYLQLFYEKM